jgi:predicted lipid carrier protein YhbT
MAETQIDPGTIDPAAFARQVRETPDEQLAEGMASENRKLVLDEVFARFAAHLKQDRAEGLDTVLHWKILDRPDGGYDHYELLIRDGTCVVNQPPKEDAAVTFKIGPVDFLKLVTGNADGPMLFLRGRLRIDGSITQAASLPSLFEIPKA